MARSDRHQVPKSAAVSPYEEGTFKLVITLVPVTFIAIVVLFFLTDG
jgi:hypothetical protein